MLERCKDAVADNRGYVLVLDDAEVKALLRLKADKKVQAIDDYLDDMFRELIM